MILTFSVDKDQAQQLVDLYNRLTGEKRVLIEAGKRYKRQDGKISGEIAAYNNNAYEYIDLDNDITYTCLGEFYPGGQDDWDLIEEYKEEGDNK